LIVGSRGNWSCNRSTQRIGAGIPGIGIRRSICVELTLRHIPYLRQHPVAVLYKEHNVGEGRLDLFIDNALVVELKAIETLAPIHTAQVISYLKTTRRHLGLLINFNSSVLKDGIKRIILS
jgi:GxxExxY protein